MGATLKSRILSFFAASAERGADTIRISSRSGPVAMLSLPSPDREGVEAESLLELLRESAIGRTSYSLSAHSAEGETLGITTLVVEGKAENGVFGAESAQERDPVVAHLLRHQDSILSQQTRALSGLLDHYRDALERSTKRIADLEATLERLRATYEEAVSLQQERELQAQERKAAQERIDKSIESILKVAGPVLSKKLGVEIPIQTPFATKGGSTDRKDDVKPSFESFLSSLSPHQIDGIAAILTEDQTKALMSLAGMKSLWPGFGTAYCTLSRQTLRV